MRLRRLTDDQDCTDLKDCPALRADGDDPDVVYVTGKRVNNPEVRALLGIGPDEDAVSIPTRLIRGLRA